MTFREKVKRVFRSKSDKSAGKPKIEYYRRHECPPSKFKGPFDRDHQKRLAAWSFAGATVEKDRACELSLSPCATYDLPSDSVAPDAVDPADPAPEPVERVDPVEESEPESSPRADDSGSQSSTILNPSSYSGSMRTLLNETSIYEIPEDIKDPKFYLKESVRYTSPCILSARKQVPFNPEDLTRALIAVQVCA
ncbi:unnamed protein product [Penicillium olsonii]|nr:unnamed protein product [Penicillium olsonii]CAG7928392.1 unnamed protein product [Penicillium olsonii]CAG8027964.1 unnamed protein product [Penicillium olsonii]